MAHLTPAVKTELVKVINLNGLLNPVAVTLRRYAPIQSGLRFLVRVSRLLCLVVHSTSDTLRLVEKLFEACIQSLLAYEWQCGAFAMVLPESHTQTLLFYQFTVAAGLYKLDVILVVLPTASKTRRRIQTVNTNVNFHPQ